MTAKNVKVIALTAAVAALIGSPWYIRNWILAGNPVYPFYYSTFGGKNWSEGLDKEFMVWLKSDYSRPALSKISSSLRRNHFHILYLLPLSLIACRRRKQILIISLGLSLFFAWYYLGTYQLRFGITWQVLLTMAISYGLLETTRYWKGYHFIILAILCGFLIQPLPRQYRSAKSRIDIALGRRSREEYMINFPGSDNTYPLIDYANKNLPEDTILATFWYNAGHHYSKHEYLMLNPLVAGIIDHTSVESPKQYAQEVMDTGATHLLYTAGKAKFFISPPRTKRYYKLHNWHRYFIENHTRLIKRNQEAFLYEITKEPGKTVLPSTFVRPNYSIMPLGETSWEDYTAEYDVIIPSSSGIECAGMLIRYDSRSDNGMRFWIRLGNPSIQLSLWSGSFKHIWEYRHPMIKPDVKYHLKFTVKGNIYSCFVNDQLMTKYEDKMRTFRKGGIGLITYGSELSAFDITFGDLVVRGYDFTVDLTSKVYSTAASR